MSTEGEVVGKDNGSGKRENGIPVETASTTVDLQETECAIATVRASTSNSGVFSPDALDPACR